MKTGGFQNKSECRNSAPSNSHITLSLRWDTPYSHHADPAEGGNCVNINTSSLSKGEQLSNINSSRVLENFVNFPWNYIFNDNRCTLYTERSKDVLR